MAYNLLYFVLLQKLSTNKASQSNFVSANLPSNKFKNRLVNILPCEQNNNLGISALHLFLHLFALISNESSAENTFQNYVVSTELP